MLVASDIGRLDRSSEIKQRRYIRFLPGSAEIVGHEAAHVLGKRDAELRGFGVGAPLQLRIKDYLGACIHDDAIMPSPRHDATAAGRCL